MIGQYTVCTAPLYPCTIVPWSHQRGGRAHPGTNREGDTGTKEAALPAAPYTNVGAGNQKRALRSIHVVHSIQYHKCNLCLKTLWNRPNWLVAVSFLIVHCIKVTLSLHSFSPFIYTLLLKIFEHHYKLSLDCFLISIGYINFNTCV